MSIIDRLQMLVRSEVNDLRGRSKNQTDVKATLEEAKRALSEVRANERSLNRRYQDVLDEVQRYEDKAVSALRAGNERLAKELLERKQDAERRAAVLRRDLDEQREYLEDLRRSLEALQIRLDASRERRRASDVHRAPPREYSTPRPTYDVSEPPSQPGPYGGAQNKRSGLERDAELHAAFGYDASDPFDRFDSLEARIAGLEAEVDAGSMLQPGHSRQPRSGVERSFERLEQDKQLQQLKRQAESNESGVDEGPLERLRRRQNQGDT